MAISKYQVNKYQANNKHKKIKFNNLVINMTKRSFHKHIGSMPAEPYSHFSLYYSQPKSKPSLSLKVHLVLKTGLTTPVLPLHNSTNLVLLHSHFCKIITATQSICLSLAKPTLLISKRTFHIWQREGEDICWMSCCH